MKKSMRADGTWTILVVEDQLQVRQSLTDALGQDYRSLATHSLNEARRVLATEEVDRVPTHQ